MRTREQIVADCEKRFGELRAEKQRRDEDPLIQRPCRTCRHCQEPDHYLMTSYGSRCHEPLVKGFRWAPRCDVHPLPCGPEKALWQPKQTLCERILEKLEALL